MRQSRLKNVLALGLASAAVYSGCEFESIETDPSKAPKQAKLIDGCDLDKAQKDLTKLVANGKAFTAFTAVEKDGPALPWSLYSVKEKTLSLSPVILMCKEKPAGFVGIKQSQVPNKDNSKTEIVIIDAKERTNLVNIDDSSDTGLEDVQSSLTFLQYDADYFSQFDQRQPSFSDTGNDNFYGASMTGDKAYDFFDYILENKQIIPEPVGSPPTKRYLA